MVLKLAKHLQIMIIFKRITCILMIMLPFAFPTPLSFDFQSFTPDVRDIEYDLSANKARNFIQLTPNVGDSASIASIGRVTYAQPLHLWDRASGNLTDFETHFKFSINSFNRTFYRDGFAFFLVPNGSRIPQNSTGGNLGLTTDSEAFNSVIHPFFAIEFDIFPNEWDPPYNLSTDNYRPREHVGVNINTVRSNVTMPWWCGNTIEEGTEHEAWVTYDSKAMNLSVTFTHTRSGWVSLGPDQPIGSMSRDGFSYMVDLRKYLPEFVNIGFTAGALRTIHSIHSWSFSSTLNAPDANEANGPSPTVSTDTPDARAVNRRKSGSKSALIIGLSIGFPVLVLLSLLIYHYYYCIGNKSKTTEIGVDDPSALTVIFNQFRQDVAPTEFAYDDLKEATNNFAQDNKLGEGGFGSVHKGLLKGNSIIAVKRICSNSEEGTKGYVAEVKIISSLRHKNLVQLLGWCHQKKEELLLVYEFMPNGSLDSHLFNRKSLLKWGIRLQIAKDLASALLYLHESWKQCVLHRDIKSSNVMLDADFNVKLGDFGLARLVDHEKGSDTVLAGTPGYMAPELFRDTSEARKETDVYSFGVVALEIATGRRAIHGDTKQGRVNLVEWSWSLHGTGKLHQGADPELGSDYNWRELVRLMTVGLWCAHPNSNSRPSIKEAIRVLDGAAPLPDIPSKMPVFTFSTSSVDMYSSTQGSATDSGSTQIMSE